MQTMIATMPVPDSKKTRLPFNADYNAAKNIAVKYAKKLRGSHKSSGGGAPVDVPMNSGLLTVESPSVVTAG